MNRPIDLEHLFHHYAADKLRVAGELDEDAAEALAEESELEITGVEVEELEGDRLRVHVRLDWNGEALSTSVTV